MKTVETEGVVQPDGTLITHLPEHIQPGKYRLVLVLEDIPDADTVQALPALHQEGDAVWLKLKPLKFSSGTDSSTFRREELYEHDDR